MKPTRNHDVFYYRRFMRAAYLRPYAATGAHHCYESSMKLIKVALLQMTGYGNDKGANLTKGEIFCRRARAMGADITLFPEMWSVGMTFFDP